jgi:drug/metabolite transporter (DMT)-like permease
MCFIPYFKLACLNKTYTGIAFAIIACIIWSGNFIVARAFIHDVPPVAMSFFRWLVATLILLPFAAPTLNQEKHLILQNKSYFFWTSLFGVAIFNTFLYIAAHTTSAINMALIGTCSSPIFSVFLAVIFLKERVTFFRIAGMLLMLAGIIFLLVKGSWERLTTFHFTTGDLWVLGAAIFFAGYNIMVRKKPQSISPVTFLFTTFMVGSFTLMPFYIWEASTAPAVNWSVNLLLVILYLGAGTSVIAFLLWNISIARLGAARTALFGNLIPLFSSLEAVWLLNEKITTFHLVSGALIVAGLVIANSRLKKA